MSGVDSYSTTPAENATCTGGAVNWAEGQAPSTVNNTARQSLADFRSAFNDLAWFQYGTGSQNTSTHLAVPAVYSSGTVFTIAGADVTAVYHVGRRVRAVGVSTGTIYGRISVTSYSPTTTTVTVVWDSGSLSNETLVISLSQLPRVGAPLAVLPSYTNFTNASSPTNNSATPKMAGFGSSFALTPTTTGKVRISISGVINLDNIAGAAGFFVNYGTGTAPSAGAAATGTHTTTGEYTLNGVAATAPFAIVVIKTGLTLATAYWFDFEFRCQTAGTVIIQPNAIIIEEIY